MSFILIQFSGVWLENKSWYIQVNKVSKINRNIKNGYILKKKLSSNYLYYYEKYLMMLMFDKV